VYKSLNGNVTKGKEKGLVQRRDGCRTLKGRNDTVLIPKTPPGCEIKRPGVPKESGGKNFKKNEKKNQTPPPVHSVIKKKMGGKRKPCQPGLQSPGRLGNGNGKKLPEK